MKSIILILSVFFLTGMGETPQTTTLKDSSGTYKLPGIGKNSVGGDRATQARVLQMMQSLPPEFDCENSNNEFICLVCNCYHEGRGEEQYVAGVNIAQVNIARVVYTRAMSGHYPSTVCGVVHQRAQFSWTLSSSKRQQVIGPGSDGFNGCVKSTQDSLGYQGKWFASHYHTTSVNPYWAKTCRGAQVVGAHRFYTGGCGGVNVRTNFDSTPSQGVDGTGV